jgi:hypothetical protein
VGAGWVGARAEEVSGALGSERDNGAEDEDEGCAEQGGPQPLDLALSRDQVGQKAAEGGAEDGSEIGGVALAKIDGGDGEVGFGASLRSAVDETLAGREGCRVEGVVLEADEAREEDEGVAGREPIEAPALVFPAIPALKMGWKKLKFLKKLAIAERNLR